MFFERGSYSVAQIGLELTVYSRLALNLQFFGLSFPTVGVGGTSYHSVGSTDLGQVGIC